MDDEGDRDAGCEGDGEDEPERDGLGDFDGWCEDDVERSRLVDRYEASLLRAYAWQGARLAPDPAFARDCLIRVARISPRATVHPKYIGAAVLSALPARVQSATNRLGHAIRRQPGNPFYVDEYEGLN